MSETDPEARFVRDGHGHFQLGYTAEIAVSQDHFIVTQRVTQAKADNHALLPLVDAVSEECQQPPGCVLADAAFSSLANLQQMEVRGIEAYIPDCNLASEMRGNLSADQLLPARDPRLLAMRHKLRSPAGRKHTFAAKHWLNQCSAP